MRIGVLEAGPVNPQIIEEYGPYTPMFERLLRLADPDITVERVVCYEGELPNSVTDADGWMITGSVYGAYEARAWYPAFETFLRDAVGAKVPVAGVCFGHQILAQALGGRVVKSEKGWGLGAQDYTMRARPAWAAPLGDGFTNYAVHQDQVIEVPPGATVVAGNTFCPIAALAYGDPDAPDAISVQPHPEFGQGFVERILDMREGVSFSNELAERARSTFARETHSQAWAEAMVGFYRTALARNAA